MTNWPNYTPGCHCISPYTKYTKPTVPPKLSNNVVIPQHEIDEVVCRWISKLLDYELEIQEAITETHRELEFLVHTYME